MTKICSVCRQSDMLCSGCNKLVSEGKISQTDIDLSRAMEKMKLQAEFFRTIDHENRIVIVAGKDAGKIIGRAGKNAAAIGKSLGKEIDVVETGDERRMIEKMLRVPTLGINKIYGQEEKYKVRVEKRFKPRIKASPSLVGMIIGKQVEILFE